MKDKTIPFIFALLLSAHISAQDPFPVGSEGNNEIKINLLLSLVEVAELDYERIINPDVSVGIAANYWFNKGARINFIATPYFRFYPSEKQRASGFFIEGNIAVVGHERRNYFYGPFGSVDRDDSKVSMGAGLAVGGKFISRSSFFGEVFGGFGRVFDNDNIVELYPRIGITLGKRF